MTFEECSFFESLGILKESLRVFQESLNLESQIILENIVPSKKL